MHAWAKIFLGQLLQATTISARHLISLGALTRRSGCYQFVQRAIKDIGNKAVEGVTNSYEKSQISSPVFNRDCRLKVHLLSELIQLIGKFWKKFFMQVLSHSQDLFHLRRRFKDCLVPGGILWPVLKLAKFICFVQQLKGIASINVSQQLVSRNACTSQSWPCQSAQC